MGVNVFQTSGVGILTGDLISYGGPSSGPANYPRGFVGSITYVPLSACSGTPVHSHAKVNDSTACPAQTVTLSLDSLYASSGISFQWMKSTTSATSGFTAISGATSSTYSTLNLTSTWYKCIVSCSSSSLSDTSSSVQVGIDSFYNCYCSSGATSNVDDDIGQFSLGAFSNPTTTPSPQAGNATSTNTYTDFTSMTAITINALIPTPISIYQINSSSSQYDCWAKVFIDYNHDGSFDTATETFFSSASNTANSYNPIGTGTVPATALAGITRCRVVLYEGGTSWTTLPCGTYTWGETEDYMVNIVVPTSCTGTLPAVTASINDSIFCAVETVHLNMDTVLPLSGISYQWQVSTTSATSGFSNISGATNTTLNTTQSVQSWYQCVLTCISSGSTVTTNVLHGKMDTFFNCYCNSAATSTADDDIGQFSIGNFSNPTTVPTPQAGNATSTGTYMDYSSLGAITLSAVIPQNVSIYQINSSNTQYNCWAKVFIDYNHDGMFDTATETFFSSTSELTNSYNPVGTGTIPVTALPGVTKMRVTLQESGNSGSVLPCNTYTWGETEDYLVNIILPSPCSGTPSHATAMINDSLFCVIENVHLSLDTVLAATGISYQWQVSTTSASAGFANISGATNSMYNTTQSVASWYRCITTCSNSSLSDTSSIVHGAMDSFYSCYCTSAAIYGGDDDIGQIIIGSYSYPAVTPTPQSNNTTSTNTYTDYTTSVPAIPLTINSTTSAAIYQINQYNFYSCWAKIFIDFNHDGAFDTATETVFSMTSDLSNNYFPIGSITVPATAMSGTTRMRIVLNESGSSWSTLPCGTYFYGETEDYLVNIGCSATVNLGSDTTVCASSGYTLNAGAASAYTWSNGATTQTIPVTSAGTYTVTVTDAGGCSGTDSVAVSFYQTPTLNLGPDTSYCEMHVLAAPTSGLNLWSNASAGTSLTVNTSGTYWLKNTDSMGCYTTDTVNLIIKPNPVVNLGNDTVVCNGAILTLNAGSGNTSYLWSNNSASPTLNVNTAGIYSVTVTALNGCKDMDSIIVTTGTSPTLSLVTPQWTTGNTVQFTSNASGATSYMWDFGDGNTSTSTSPTHTYASSGTYSVCLTVSNSCGDSSFCRDIVLGLENVVMGSNFRVYPNPAHDKLVVELNSNIKVDKIYLVNQLGQNIELNYVPKSTNSYEINLPKVSEGNYILRVQSDKTIYNKSILIH